MRKEVIPRAFSSFSPFARGGENLMQVLIQAVLVMQLTLYQPAQVLAGTETLAVGKRHHLRFFVGIQVYR